MSTHFAPTKEGRNESDPTPVDSDFPGNGGEGSEDFGGSSDSNAKGEDTGGHEVTFEHVNSLKEVKIHAGKTETLSELWDEACVLLHEPRRPDDRLQTARGKDVMSYLSFSLSQLREKGIKEHKFEILGPTGGA